MLHLLRVASIAILLRMILFYEAANNHTKKDLKMQKSTQCRNWREIYKDIETLPHKTGCAISELKHHPQNIILFS